MYGYISIYHILIIFWKTLVITTLSLSCSYSPSHIKPSREFSFLVYPLWLWRNGRCSKYNPKVHVRKLRWFTSHVMTWQGPNFYVSFGLFQLAGVLSLVSSEVSAFMIFLITVDRFIVLRFPFSTKRFNRSSALIACLLAWMSGLCIAVYPLVAFTGTDFYGHSGICIPLPVTRKYFHGQQYSFSILIILNFVLFLSIAVGQVAIFVTVKMTSMKRSVVFFSLLYSW